MLLLIIEIKAAHLMPGFNCQIRNMSQVKNNLESELSLRRLRVESVTSKVKFRMENYV